MIAITAIDKNLPIFRVEWAITHFLLDSGVGTRTVIPHSVNVAETTTRRNCSAFQRRIRQYIPKITLTNLALLYKSANHYYYSQLRTIIPCLLPTMRRPGWRNLIALLNGSKARKL